VSDSFLGNDSFRRSSQEKFAIYAIDCVALEDASSKWTFIHVTANASL